MKTILTILVGATVASNAALIRFDLSPPGTDAAVGLSPTNQSPPVTTSTGSGNTVSGGILFDTDSSTLQVAIGYGSAAGFTDLTGPATAMHIHGPAGVGANAAPFIDLSPYSFPAVDPAQGGIIYGTLPFPPDAVSNLFAGNFYVNIHTAANPGGEIRGQLIEAVNAPPTITCGDPATVECGTAVATTVLVSDAEGDALTVLWTVNGDAVQTNTLPASTPSASTPVSIQRVLPLGTNVVTTTVTDTASNTASCSTLVIVVDTTPPEIVSVSADPSALWPPNHKLVPITLRVQATDSCSETRWRITGVRSNEPVNGQGDGNTGPDWVITGAHGLKLRAERSGRGNGRVYTIGVQATDASGNVSETKTVTVSVPKSQGHQ